MRTRPLILIVDDEEDFLEILSTKLKASGFEIATAKNGQEALDHAKELVPDLVLMDISMPKMTGTEAALAIKETPETADVKIAFLTGLDDPWPGFAGEKEAVAGELGMQGFIEKPDDLDVLVERIKHIVESP